MNSQTDLGFARPIARAAIFAMLWWMLTGGDAPSWIVGGPVVLVATALSLSLRPEQSWRWRLAGVLPMGWFFLRQSLRGGFDVARRALHPRLPLNPGVLRFNTRLPAGSARLFFIGLISLLPGTLVLGIEEAVLEIHALAVGPSAELGLRALEERVAGLFGFALRVTEEAKS